MLGFQVLTIAIEGTALQQYIDSQLIASLWQHGR